MAGFGDGAVRSRGHSTAGPAEMPGENAWAPQAFHLLGRSRWRPRRVLPGPRRCGTRLSYSNIGDRSRRSDVAAVRAAGRPPAAAVVEVNHAHAQQARHRPGSGNRTSDTGVRRGSRPRSARADALRPVLREEPDSLRHLQVVDLHDGPLRNLLLP